MEEYNEFVPNVHFELIPIKSLVSNQDYQRNLSIQHIKKTAENFDRVDLVKIKIVRRSLDITDTDISLVILIGNQIFDSNLFKVDLRNKL